ncbi:hypothetical protein MUP59_03630 [Candidatus Bathyarchaeota archaeon]|nr:hypothetical protein [Candidatus Bathyarchaeota archaeon]
MAEAMHQHNETLTDPVAKLKARAMSAIILEAMLVDGFDKDQQTTKEEEEEEEEIARLATQHETILRRIFADATTESKKEEVASPSSQPEESTRVEAPNTSCVVLGVANGKTYVYHRQQPIESKKEEEEEAASPSSQPEDRATAFVTDEPDDEPEAKKESQAQPQSPERMIHTLIFGRDGCSAVTSESEAAQREREMSREMDRRMMSSPHSWWNPRICHQHNQEAPKTVNPGVNLSDFITRSAKQVRDNLVLNYVTKIAKCIADCPETRCISYAVRMIDIDLIPMIKAPFIAKGYKCIGEGQRVISITW